MSKSAGQAGRAAGEPVFGDLLKGLGGSASNGGGRKSLRRSGEPIITNKDRAGADSEGVSVPVLVCQAVTPIYPETDGISNPAPVSAGAAAPELSLAGAQATVEVAAPANNASALDLMEGVSAAPADDALTASTPTSDLGVAAQTNTGAFTGDLAFALKLESQSTAGPRAGTLANNAQATGGEDSVKGTATLELDPGPASETGAAPEQSQSERGATDHREGRAPTSGRKAASVQRPEFPGTDASSDRSGASPARAAAPFVRESPVVSQPSPRSMGPVENSAASKPEAAPIYPAAAPKSVGPIKEMSVQLGQPLQERVELRVTERGGELRVAVRSAGAEVAHNLQDGLHDLVNRLEDQGFRTAAWRPSGAVTAAGSAGESRQSSAQSQNGDAQQGWSRQERGQRDQDHNSRPKWVEELDTDFTTGGERWTGEFHGFGN